MNDTLANTNVGEATASPTSAHRLAVALLIFAAPLATSHLAAGAVPTIRPVVVATYPHDTSAFTQGLLVHDRSFCESTGLEGQSSLRRVDVTTGQVQHRVELLADEFGEGLALVDDRLIQLTWQDGIAHVYDRDTFEARGSFSYTGEGWGLCYDGNRLVMSDGSSSLFFRDADSFELVASVQVRLDGNPVTRLNELECVGSLVYANVWLTDTILRIDPRTGTVLTTIDASGLLDAEAARAADVLNGIAFDSGTERFFLTGKLWPTVFEVHLEVDPYEEDTSPGASDAGATSEPATDETESPSDDSGPTAKEPSGGCRMAPKAWRMEFLLWGITIALGIRWRRVLTALH